ADGPWPRAAKAESRRAAESGADIAKKTSHTQWRLRAQGTRPTSRLAGRRGLGRVIRGTIWLRARKKSCNDSQQRLTARRPISHVPVAVCRSVGIRTRGRTAARSEIARTKFPGTDVRDRWQLRKHLTGSRRRNRRTPLSTGDAA